MSRRPFKARRRVIPTILKKGPKTTQRSCGFLKKQKLWIFRLKVHKLDVGQVSSQSRTKAWSQGPGGRNPWRWFASWSIQQNSATADPKLYRLLPQIQAILASSWCLCPPGFPKMVRLQKSSHPGKLLRFNKISEIQLKEKSHCHPIAWIRVMVARSDKDRPKSVCKA